MKITVLEDGLNIFIPDEELPELYSIINAHHYSELGKRLLNEVVKFIPPKTLEELQK